MNEKVMKDLPSDSHQKYRTCDQPFVCSNGGQDCGLLLKERVIIGGVGVDERSNLGHNDRRLDRSCHVDNLLTS